MLANDFSSSDKLASKLVPSDVSEHRYVNTSGLTPVAVSAHGNCLPRSGSVLSFGHENVADEIPARLVTELVLNEDYYLNGSFLRQGAEFNDKVAGILPISYAMYSDQYDPSANVKLTPVTIVGIYHRENINITR